MQLRDLPALCLTAYALGGLIALALFRRAMRDAEASDHRAVVLNLRRKS
ncbi:hypothetical protein [Nocardioides sp. InS609-2]|nr:hypothetical protein [Nocardioides sp. InS609-2]